jgi:hypothetical protein
MLFFGSLIGAAPTVALLKLFFGGSRHRQEPTFPDVPPTKAGKVGYIIGFLLFFVPIAAVFLYIASGL